MEELRLRDLPEMGYLTSDVPPRGEILARVEPDAAGRVPGKPGVFGPSVKSRRIRQLWAILK